MVNLISNAVKFNRARSQAEIEIGCTGRKNDHVVLFVRDKGVGFDMKYSNKLFGVFQRLHPQEAFKGTGIGLATVQRMYTAMAAEYGRKAKWKAAIPSTSHFPERELSDTWTHWDGSYWSKTTPKTLSLR